MSVLALVGVGGVLHGDVPLGVAGGVEGDVLGVCRGSSRA